MGSIVIGNRGQRLCYLQGVPEILLYDAAGRSIPLKLSPAQQGFSSDKVLVEPGSANIQAYSSAAGGASLVIVWPTHDGAGTCSPPAPQGTELRVRLPDEAGTLVVPVIDPRNHVIIAACGGYLSVSPFQMIKPPTPVSTPAPERFAVRLQAPAEVKVGQVLRYTAHLRNITAEPIVLGADCPAYLEWAVDEAGTSAFGKAAHVLNCTGLDPIPPRQTVAFAMEMEVPAGTVPGLYTVVWRFMRPDSGDSSTVTIKAIR